MTEALEMSEKERMKTEETVREKDAVQKELKKFEALVEQTGDNIIITDYNTVVEYVNPSFERTTGYSKEEIIGKRIDILRSGRHEESFYKNLKNTLDSGNTWRDHVWIKAKDGRNILHDASITPIKYGEDNIHYVSIRKDITNEIKMREMMIQSEKMMAVGGLAAGINTTSGEQK